MNVLFQAYGPDRGGGIANVHLLIKAYARTVPGDSITIVCSRGAPLEDMARSPNCRVIALPNDRWKEFRRFWLNCFELKRIARREQSDVIWSLNLGPYVRTGTAQCLSIHNAYQIYPLNETRTHPGGRLRVAALRYLFRRSLDCSDGVVLNTPTMAEMLRKSQPSPPRIAIVPKAVENDDDLQSEPLPAALSSLFPDPSVGHPFTFLYVSTFAAHKNHRIIIAALDRLQSDGIDARLAVTISPEDAIRASGEIGAGLIKTGHLLPLGWVAKKYLRSLYTACDACLMPSTLESMSSAYMEAMAWGRPQIVADLPHARDLCGPAALFSAPGDAGDWADKMRIMMQDAGVRSRLTALGVEQIRKYPAQWAQVAHMLRKFLGQVVEAKRNPQAQYGPLAG